VQCYESCQGRTGPTIRVHSENPGYTNAPQMVSASFSETPLARTVSVRQVASTVAFISLTIFSASSRSSRNRACWREKKAQITRLGRYGLPNVCPFPAPLFCKALELLGLTAAPLGSINPGMLLGQAIGRRPPRSRGPVRQCLDINASQHCARVVRRLGGRGCADIRLQTIFGG